MTDYIMTRKEIEKTVKSRSFDGLMDLLEWSRVQQFKSKNPDEWDNRQAEIRIIRWEIASRYEARTKKEHMKNSKFTVNEAMYIQDVIERRIGRIEREIEEEERQNNPDRRYIHHIDRERKKLQSIMHKIRSNMIDWPDEA